MYLLFHKERCFFCRKVRTYMAEQGIEATEIVADDGSGAQKVLEKLGGKAQVPFLVDLSNGDMMYESDDIIKYLSERKA